MPFVTEALTLSASTKYYHLAIIMGNLLLMRNQLKELYDKKWQDVRELEKTKTFTPRIVMSDKFIYFSNLLSNISNMDCVLESGARIRVRTV